MPINRMFLYFLLTLFSSCSGQVKKTDLPITIGQVVTEVYKSIWVIYQDKNNNYWFGSNGQGVFYYNGKEIRQITMKDGLVSNQLRGIQEDKSGNLFFETPGGISKFDGQKISTLEPIIPVTNQWKLHPDDLWFKRNGANIGVYRYDGSTLYELNFSTLNPKAYDSSHAVYSIYKDRKGHIWIGTLTGGVCRFDGKKLEWIYEKELGALEDGRVPGIRAILEDDKGDYWFSNLLYQYNIKNNPFEQNKIKYDRISKVEPNQLAKLKLPYFNSALVDKKTIWMTHYNEGISALQNGVLTNYLIKDGEKNVQTMFIFKDQAGSIWLGTDNAGVYRFNGKAFEKF